MAAEKVSFELVQAAADDHVLVFTIHTPRGWLSLGMFVQIFAPHIQSY